jgi:hypothetical protein
MHGVTVKIMVFYVFMPCSIVYGYKRTVHICLNWSVFPLSCSSCPDCLTFLKSKNKIENFFATTFLNSEDVEYTFTRNVDKYLQNYISKRKSGARILRWYICIFFSTGATTHCGFVFCSPLAGL